MTPTCPSNLYRIDEIKRLKNISESINNACFIEIVGCHFQFDVVACGQSNEPFSHFTRDMRQNQMIVRQRNAEHASRQDGNYSAVNSNTFF